MIVIKKNAIIPDIRKTQIVRLNPQPKIHKIKNLGLKDRIGISTSDGIEIIKMSEVTYCMAEGNYCNIYCRDGQRIVASKTLKIVASALCDKIFLRVHQSYLICLSDIKKVYKEYIILDGGKSIPVSRANRSVLMDRLQEITNVLK